jgi:hypothetical protein
MRILWVTLSIIIALGAYSCAKNDIPAYNRYGEPISIDYSYIDDKDRRKIILSYKNTLDYPICLGIENWPQNEVIINNGSIIFLEIGGANYYLNAETDYCPQCTIKVGPAEQITASLPYEKFGLPDSLYNQNKVLHYDVYGFRCDRI